MEAVVREQAAVIKDRLRQSSLPLEQILIPNGIFTEQGWVIQKRGGEVNAIQKDGITSLSETIPLMFEEIDPLLANQIHNDLHYIHTPRSDIALAYLKTNYPDIQAIMSSFMPSYATGVSMTSGGFDNPVLINPLDHVFARKDVAGDTVYEHLTRRRRQEGDGNILSS